MKRSIIVFNIIVVISFFFKGCSIVEVKDYKNSIFYKVSKDIRKQKVNLLDSKYSKYYSDKILFVPKMNFDEENTLRVYLQFYSYVKNFTLKILYIEINGNRINPS